MIFFYILNLLINTKEKSYHNLFCDLGKSFHNAKRKIYNLTFFTSIVIIKQSPF